MGARAVRLDDADAATPRRADAEDVGERRAAAGTCLTGQHAAYDDPLAHDVGTQRVGTGLGRHVGILEFGA
jgi:hypothetical protein